MLLAALALAIQAAPAPAATPAPAPRPPITLPPIDFDAPDWQLSRAPGSCAASVALSGGARLLIAYHGGQNLSFVNLIDPALALTAGSTGRALVRFGSFPEESVEARARSFENDGTVMLGLAPSRNTGRLRGLAEAGSISIAYGGRPPVTHAVPGAREGVQRLLACAEEARAALPVAEQVPRAWLSSYFSVSDYPREAVLTRQQGTVRFWVKVSAEGRVTDCQIIQSSGTAALDEATCRIIRERARYEPVRNAQGQPVESFDGDYSITWRLP
jgi:TonB family protein